MHRADFDNQMRASSQTAGGKALLWAAGALTFGVLYVSSRSNYLLFHTLAELFSNVIGFGIFMIAWNSRRFLQNNYLLLLGTGFLFITALDLAHTLAYKGMGVLPTADANPATQLWIAARFTEAISLLAAPLVLRRRLHAELVFFAYAVVTTLLLLSVFVWKIFPVCYIEGHGLTPFKKISEYVISVTLLGAMVSLYIHRKAFDAQVRRLLMWALGLTIASELAFTTYVNVYGSANMVGHFLKIAAFFLVYKAIIETGLTKPHSLLLRQVTQSEERYRLLFDLSPDGIFTVDPSGRFLMANPACEVLSGYTPEELTQRTFMDICAPELLQKTVAHFRDHLANPEYKELETALLRKDGRLVDVWVAGKPLLSDGRIIGVHCTARDISERKQFQVELERLVGERTAKLQEMVDELEHFSYTITHDMRAPLRAMHGFAGILKESCGQLLNFVQTGYLDNILTSARRMDRLITDALHYSKAVRQELSQSRVETGALVEGIINSYPGLQPPRAQIRIEGSLPPVLANEAGLTQCFSNLLSNAVKFVEPGKTPEIRVRAERIQWSSSKPRPARSAGPALFQQAQEAPAESEPLTGPLIPAVRIWVEDNGIGIPRNVQARLFQMFQRASRDYEGTGVGLALVRKVTERMGGRVGVQSEPGKGSRFWLEFKAAD